MWSLKNKMFAIKKVFFISFVILLTTFNAYAADKNIIKVTKNIKYLSQNIVNNYLYLYNKPKKVESINSIKSDIKELEDNFRFIAKNSNDSDIKNVLDFLSYSKDQIKEILDDDISKDNLLTMIDLSDTLVEGTNSILESKDYKSFDSKFHLMMISKLYMLINLDFNQEENRNLLKQELKLFDNHALNDSWITLKDIVNNKEKHFIPNIVSILVKDLKNSMEEI
jgi:hypothetical protein